MEAQKTVQTKLNTEVTIAGVTFKNPVMTASGTFGSGMEYGEFVDLNKLGAVVTKGVANVPWPGNPTPRVTETYGGMLNAIGLQNPGIDVFIERDLEFLKQYDKIVEVIEENAKIVVNDNVDLYKSINDKAVNVTEGAICKFSYIELVNMKLMDEDTINPKTNKTINGDSYIVVNKKNNKLSYEFYYENIPEIEDCE